MATVKTIEIKLLKNAKHNPTSRTRNINSLAKSIEKVGLLDPIKISSDNCIIDGHRRVAAYKKIGLLEIECLILAGDPAENYAELNWNKKSLNGNETLEIYLEEPSAVTYLIRARLDEALDVIGPQLMNRLAKEGYSLASINLARTIVKLNDRETPENVIKALKWLLHFNNFGIVRRAISAGLSAGKVWAAIERNKTLRMTFDISNK